MEKCNHNFQQFLNMVMIMDNLLFNKKGLEKLEFPLFFHNHAL